jgi:hypothetical protein
MADPATLSTLTMRRPARRSPAEQRSPGSTPGRWPPPSSRSPRRAWPTMATVRATADMADNPKLRPRGPATPSTGRSRRPASTPGSQARPTDPAPLTDRQAVRWQPTRPRDRPLARGPGGTWPTCACRRTTWRPVRGDDAALAVLGAGDGAAGDPPAPGAGLTWGTETARPTPGRAPRAATETGSFPVRLGVGGPAAPVTGVAAARNQGRGRSPLGLAGGPAARAGRGAGRHGPPRQGTTQDPVPRTALTHHRPPAPASLTSGSIKTRSPPYPGPGDHGHHDLASDTAGAGPAPGRYSGRRRHRRGRLQRQPEHAGAAKPAAMLQKLTGLDARP